MFRHLRRIAGLLLLTALTSTMLVAPQAAAANGKHYDCYRADYGCVAGTGYAGQANWGYPGPHNCTLYAAYRLSRNGYGNPAGLGNAYEWDERARARGVVVDQNPAVGAIAQSDVSPGHVMYVDEVHADHIVITEDNWGGGTGRARIYRGTPAWNTLEFIHFRDISGSYPDGTFIRDADTGEVFRIAGGAPLYVSTWSAFGAPQPVTNISHAAVLALPHHPADGTFVVGTARGEVYRFAGGAPLYVSTWNAFGGQQPLVAVDQAALDNAGAGGVWNHARPHPADGTFVVGTARGEVYRFAGGAPLYVSTWDAFGGPQPLTAVDQAALDNAGAGSVWNHARAVPADGTFVVGTAQGEVYRFAGGAPLYVSTWDTYGGPQPLTAVDQAALDNAGAGGVWNHARFYPADHTLLVTNQDGRVWQVLNHVAVYVRSWDEVGGPQPTTGVDLAAVLNAGQPGAYSHLSGYLP
jgi:surface antigen